MVVGSPGTYWFVGFMISGGVSSFLSDPIVKFVLGVGRLCLYCSCSIVLPVGLV